MVRYSKRLAKLEAKSRGSGMAVFIYRRIMRPVRGNEEGPEVVSSSFCVEGERHVLYRQDGETVDSLEDRMQRRVVDMTGSRYAFSLDECVMSL